MPKNSERAAVSRPFRRSELLLTIALSLLILIAAFSWQSWQNFRNSTRDVKVSRAILDHTSHLLKALTDAETGQRGFLLTGRHDYLAPFNSGVREVPMEFEALEQAVRDVPEQHPRVAALRPLIADKTDELRATIGLREREGEAAALRMVNTDQGRRAMMAIRELCQMIQDSEFARRAAHAAAAERSGDRALLGTMTGSSALFVLVAWAMVAIKRGNIQREQLIDELHERGELLQTTLTSIGDAVIVTDARGNVTLQNQLSAELTGWSDAEAIGRPLREVFLIENEATGERVESPVDKVLREGSVVGLANHTVLAGKHGRRVHIEDSGAPIRGADGRIFGVVLVYRDVSENRRIQQESLRLEKKLQETARLESLGILAGGIAHDFNNLLVGILGNASLAMEMDTLSEARPLIRQAIQTSERAAHLTRQMLAYAGKGKLLVEQINLSAYVRETLPLIETSVPRTVRVHVEIPPPESSLVVRADVAQVQQILMNLVINAAEAYEGQTGTVHVRVFPQQLNRDAADAAPDFAELPPGDYVCLEVSDKGCGMDPATRQKIFDPFFSTKFSGRGLGLSAVVGIVRGHKGAIQIQSAPGEGATFRVLLPATPDAAPPPVKETAPEDSRGRGTILVVDDEHLVREFIGNALVHLGYGALYAGDGDEALRILHNPPEPVAAVILDMTMPVRSGEETLREIRQLHPRLPVVISSGFSGADAVHTFGKYGISGFIQKPYTIARLAEQLRGALDDSAARPGAARGAES